MDYKVDPFGCDNSIPLQSVQGERVQILHARLQKLLLDNKILEKHAMFIVNKHSEHLSCVIKILQTITKNGAGIKPPKDVSKFYVSCLIDKVLYSDKYLIFKVLRDISSDFCISDNSYHLSTLSLHTPNNVYITKQRETKLQGKERERDVFCSPLSKEENTKIDSSSEFGLILKGYGAGTGNPEQIQPSKDLENKNSFNSLQRNFPITVWGSFVQDISSTFTSFTHGTNSIRKISNEKRKNTKKSSISFFQKKSKEYSTQDSNLENPFFDSLRKENLSEFPPKESKKTREELEEDAPRRGPSERENKITSPLSFSPETGVPRGLSVLANTLLSVIGEASSADDFASKMSSLAVKFWTRKQKKGEEKVGEGGRERGRLQLVANLKMKAKRGKRRIWSPSLIVYDTGACTKEEHDPAKAVLYHRPRNAPMNTRTAICGQIAGVIHFCRAAFSAPSTVKTKYANVAMKHYGRFVLMVTGISKEWAESRLATVSRLLDAATGGIPLLWKENHQDRSAFVQKLSSLLDAIVFHALPDVNFEDGIFASSSVSTSLSSGISPSSDLLEELDSEKTVQEEGGASVSLWRRKKGSDGENKSVKSHFKGETDLAFLEDESNSEENIMATLHREFNAVPSVPLPKSGGCAFLKSQQLLEVCQQHSGVLAGSTSFRNRVLNTQIEPELGLVLASLNDNDSEANEILQKKTPQFELPKDVALYSFNLSQGNLFNLAKSIPKLSMKRGGRKGLHNEVPFKDLSSLRSALQNQSLHSYPSSIPPLINKTSCDQSEAASDSQYKRPLDPLFLCAKISRNGDLLIDGRPSRSLPGSPRKIRVPTMLPDVGSDSPELRYKVLTTRRPKPGTSSNNTPRKVPGNKFGTVGKVIEGQNNGILHRGNNLTAPSLKRKEYAYKAEQSKSTTILESNSQVAKENIHSIGQRQFTERSNNMEINIKNTKNKLNLHFAPDKVNRPRDDYDTEVKISREINGNLSKDNLTKECLTSNGNSLKNQLIELHDDDDASKSEESEISVLELGSFLESKENGNKMFAEATRPDSPKSDTSGTNEDNGVFEGWAESDELGLSNLITNTVENQWTKVILYTQKSSNMLLFLFLDNKAASNQPLIYDLYRLASSALPEVETNLVKILEMSEEREGETFLRKSYSVLTALDLASLYTPLVIEAHRDFVKYQNLTEVTLREGEKVIWCHRNCQTETFYQSIGASRPGLPIPSDVMARIPHRARRRLERDHGITIL